MLEGEAKMLEGSYVFQVHIGVLTPFFLCYGTGTYIWLLLRCLIMNHNLLQFLYFYIK